MIPPIDAIAALAQAHPLSGFVVITIVGALLLVPAFVAIARDTKGPWA